MGYFVGVVTFQQEQENVMSNDSKYSIKLANGKERAFDSAAAMAKWIDEQRELKVPRRKGACLLYTSPSPRDLSTSRMPSSA